MKKFLTASIILAVLPHLFGEVYSDVVGLVQFASEHSLMTRGSDATPGVVFATEYIDSGSNSCAYLTVGNPNGVRVPVIDKNALRRTPFEYIDYPNFYIELGENQMLIDDYTVMPFYNYVEPAKSEIDPTHVTYTQTFKLIPQNGYRLIDADVTLGEWSMEPHPDFGKWTSPSIHVTEVGGVLYVEVTTVPWSKQVVYNVQVVVSRIRAMNANIHMMRDDLVTADYFFKDKIGDTSLGTIRTWVTNRYDGYKANLWSTFPAISDIDMAGRGFRYTSRFHQSLGSISSTNDTLTIWASGQRALSLMTAIGGGTNDFRIIAIDVTSSPDYDYLYGEIGYGEPYAIACNDINVQAWESPIGQITSRTLYDGTDCYCVAVPKDSSSTRFYRLVANGDDGLAFSGAVYTDLDMFARSISLRDEMGRYWKLSVNTNGVLGVSEEPVDSPIH